MEMTMNNKKRLLIFCSGLLFGVILLTFSIVLNTKYSNKIRTNIYKTEQLYQIENDDSLVSNLVLEKEAWSNSTSVIDEKEYTAYQYNIEVTNTARKIESYYEIKIQANEDMLLLTIWCGKKIQVHQFRDGEEIIEDYDFSSPNENTRLDLTRDSSSSLIRLYKGDYFIYYPHYSGWELPISYNSTVRPGFICYQESDISKINPNIDFIYEQSEPTKIDDINFKIESRNDIYGKSLDGSGNPNYVMDTLDINIDNYTKKDISSYSFKLISLEKTYLNNMWNGQIEVHQFNDGKERTQTIKDPRTIKSLALNNDLNLDYIDVDGEVSITLNENDYLIYTPYDYQTDNLGMILLYPNNESKPKISIEYYYKLDFPLFQSWLFWLAIFSLLVVIIYAIVLFVLDVKLHRYEVEKQHDERAIEESMETFVNFIDAKDPYTQGHSKRVAYYSKEIASALRFSEDDTKRIYYIGLMHDCGKIGIPDNILTKPGKLTKEEYEIIKSHTTIGSSILGNFSSIKGIQDGVLYHHEHYDGTGYPKGLKGEEIPIVARIICVADTYDAMTSKRCYRDPMSKKEVINEFLENKGTQFDPNIVDTFISVVIPKIWKD